MGFDAGSITGHMKLTRDEWRAALEEVKAQGEELSRDEIRVPVTMDTAGFLPDAAEVQAVKDELGQGVDVPVRIEETGAARAIAEMEAVKAAAHDLGRTFEDLGNLGQQGAGSRGLVQSMLDAGVAESELLTALRGLGIGRTDAEGMIAEAARAAETAAIEAAALRDQIIARYVSGIFSALERTPLSLGQGAGGYLPALAPLDPFIASLGYRPDWTRPMGELPSWSRGLPALRGAPWTFGTPGPSVGSYTWLRDLVGGATFIELPAGAVRTESGGTGGSLRTALAALRERAGALTGPVGDLWGSLFAGWGTRGLLGLGGAKGLTSSLLGDASFAEQAMIDRAETLIRSGSVREGLALADLAVRTGGRITRDMAEGLAQGMVDEARAAAGLGTRTFATITSGIGGVFGGLTSAYDRVAGWGPGFVNPWTLALSPTLVPIGGAVGAALGGAVAGTAIGGAGFLAAVVPGLLALQKGYAAYQAQAALAKTATTATAKRTLATASPGTLAIGGALGRLVGSGSSFLSGIETQITPGILRFLAALGTVARDAAPFINVAVTALTRFFGVVDAGMQSAGFRSFVSTMTHDLGPIMSDFGLVVERLGTAFGHFLVLFGGKPAQMVGDWFVRVTGDLTHFLANVHFGPGFLQGMVTAFDGLGSVLHFLAAGLDVLAKGAAPVGLTILEGMRPVFDGLASALEHLPPWAVTVVTGLVGAFSGFLALAGVAKIITGLGGALAGLIVANPELLALAAALTGLAIALSKLHTAPPVTPQQFGALVHAFQTTPSKRTPSQRALIGRAQAILGQTARTQLLTPPGQNPTATHFTIRHLTRTVTARHHALAQLGTPNKNWAQDIGGASNEAWQKVDNNFIHPLVHGFTTVIPHAFESVGGAFAHAWGVVEAGAVTIWQRIDHGIVQPVVSFFGSSIPHAFAAVPSAFDVAWGHVESTAVTIWHWLYGHVFGPIESFFTRDLPNAVGSIAHPFQVAFGIIESVVTRAWGFLSRIFGYIVGGIDTVRNAVSGLSHLLSGGGIPTATQHYLQSVHAGSVASRYGYAGGGAFGPGTYVVGETGPELVRFNGSGFVTPNNRLGTGSGGTVINITVDARGAQNPAAVREQVTVGIGAAIPKLRMALERGAA